MKNKKLIMKKDKIDHAGLAITKTDEALIIVENATKYLLAILNAFEVDMDEETWENLQFTFMETLHLIKEKLDSDWDYNVVKSDFDDIEEALKKKFRDLPTPKYTLDWHVNFKKENKKSKLKIAKLLKTIKNNY